MSTPPADLPPTTATPATPTPPAPTDSELKLYTLLVDQVQKYSTIVWQFPTALLAANTFAIDKFLLNPHLLAGLAIVDAALVFAFYRLVLHQRTVIDTTRNAEVALRKTAAGAFIPEFSPPSLRATTVTLVVLSLMTGALAIYAAARLFKAYLCCCCH